MKSRPVESYKIFVLGVIVDIIRETKYLPYYSVVSRIFRLSPVDPTLTKNIVVERDSVGS